LNLLSLINLLDLKSLVLRIKKSSIYFIEYLVEHVTDINK